MATTIPAPPASALELAEKNFRPAAVEADLYEWWERSGFFKPDEGSHERPFVMMLPLPNVTGDLHLGHALGFGGYEDLIARWHRMRGEPTLYMPGTDHAGIIAQYVVEQELAKEGITRQQLGREKVLEEMWKWMDHYRPRIEKQLRLLGCSLDWSRPNFTMEPSKQRAVRTHFIRLYKRGHLYRDDRIVHWCLQCQTTYSDLEVKHVERTDPLYYVRYPWAGAMPAGTPDVVVATTRPETIVADVAVAMHPDDERWKALVGKEVLVPIVERRVRIIADEAVDPSFGTGALKITPGHDATDFEIGKRHGLPVISVIDKRGMMTPAAGSLAGPDRDTARAMMVSKLRAKGLIVREEQVTHAIGVHERCGTVDEPLVMKQWWVRMDRLAPPAIAAVRDGRITIHPRYQEKVFFNWMENIRDWPVSRQIWWGHSIPAWFCRDCDAVIVPDEDAPDPTRCPKCRSDDIYQDPDVLDTWFSSALWPFTTLGWPDETPDLRRYYPGSLLETGYDIVFFWVARMIMMGLEEMGDIPFHSVYLHGLVRVGSVKMSKSLGNVVSPVGLIEEHGADALRFALVNGVAAGADSQLSQDRLDHARNFANKLWNISRFALRQIDEHPEAFHGHTADQRPQAMGDEARWILSRTDAAIAESSRLIEGYLFGEYLAALEGFVWGELADIYVELAKPSLRSGDATETVRTLAYALDRVLRLLHPSMPFITETIALQLWQRTGKSEPSASLVVSRWPEPGARDSALEERFAVFVDVVRTIRNLRQQAGLDPSARARVSLAGETASIRELLGQIGELTRSEVTVGRGEGTATVVRAIEVRLAAKRDAAGERERLERELALARDLVRRSRELLGREGFAEKAPKEVVEKERAKLAEREERVRLLEQEIRRLE
ncbi:MAG TPA: valine--tRNA ligase [Candidatus Limnocylindria bacterium]|nr:valine--tRNA ligase [Candidatus Limnocylindria bacterium]